MYLPLPGRQVVHLSNSYMGQVIQVLLPQAGEIYLKTPRLSVVETLGSHTNAAKVATCHRDNHLPQHKYWCMPTRNVLVSGPGRSVALWV